MPLHHNTVLTAGRLIRILTLLNLRDYSIERLADILVEPRTRLDPSALELRCQLLTRLFRHLPLLRSHIALVADYNHGHGILSEVVENLLADDAYHLKGLLARYRVDDHVSMDADEVLRVEYRVFVLHHIVNISHAGLKHEKTP